MKRVNALACLPKKLIDKPEEAAVWMAQKRAKDAASAKVRRLQNLDRYRANERRNYERTREARRAKYAEEREARIAYQLTWKGDNRDRAKVHNQRWMKIILIG